MSKFYCNICNEEVILENGICPKCKTNWINIINGENEKPIIKNDNKIITSQELNMEISEETLNEEKITIQHINKNIRFFLNWAIVGKIFMILVAFILAIFSFDMCDETNGDSLYLLVAVIGIIFFTFIFENLLKWKAYMLHTNLKK